MKYLNVRGPNGSGKTTLLRCLARDPLCRVEHVLVPDEKPIPVTFVPGGLAMIGDYTPAAKGTTAGCDRIRTQAAVKSVLELIGRRDDVQLVIFEGVVIATIFGPWLDWERENGGMVWAFLDTPLDVCLARVQERNGGKAVKEDQIADKHRTIRRVRDKVLQTYPAGGRVADIRWQTALKDLKSIVATLLSGSSERDSAEVWPEGQALEPSAPSRAPVARKSKGGKPGEGYSYLAALPEPSGPTPKTVFRDLVRACNSAWGVSLPATEGDLERLRPALEELIAAGYFATPEQVATFADNADVLTNFPAAPRAAFYVRAALLDLQYKDDL